MTMLTVVPAYGRDYKSRKEVEQAVKEGKDFLIQDISSPYNGSYVSCRDLKPGDSLRVRYKKLTQVTTVKV